MNIEKPRRPYKSLRDAAANIYIKNVESLGKDEYPCLKCHGRGYLHEWTGIGSDYNDEDCIACSSSGIISKQKFEEWYNSVMDSYRKRLQEYNEKNAIRKQILRKLTPIDIKFILNHGL